MTKITKEVIKLVEKLINKKKNKKEREIKKGIKLINKSLDELFLEIEEGSQEDSEYLLNQIPYKIETLTYIQKEIRTKLKIHIKQQKIKIDKYNRSLNKCEEGIIKLYNFWKENKK